jgi:hypothetical protein
VQTEVSTAVGCQRRIDWPSNSKSGRHTGVDLFSGQILRFQLRNLGVHDNQGQAALVDDDQVKDATPLVSRCWEIRPAEARP